MAHQTFGIPVKLTSHSIAGVGKQSDKAEVLKAAWLLLWDEAPMAHKDALEVVDRLLKDLMDSEEPFGEKVMVLGGDF